MFVRQILFSVICIGTLFPFSSIGYSGSSYYPSYYSSSSNSSGIATLAAAVVGTLAAGYGVYKVTEWLFSRTDEQLISDVAHALSQAHATYQDDVRKMSRYASNPYDADEGVLYDLALSCLYKKVSIQSYIQNLSYALHTLNSEIKEMNGHLGELANQRYSDVQAEHMYQKMSDLRNQTQKIVGSLHNLKELVSYHKTYFELYEKEAALIKEYDQELRILTNYGHDGFAFEKMMRAQIITPSRGSYPYMTYAHAITKRVDELARLMQNAYYYPARSSAAQELYGKLDSIKRHVMTDPTYMHEVREYERVLREQERLAAQQAQIWAMQQQANALYAYNKQLERANELKAQELRWKQTPCTACFSSTNCVLCDEYWYCPECVAQGGYTPTCSVTVQW